MPPAIAAVRGISGAGVRKKSTDAVRSEARMNLRGIQNAGIAANDPVYKDSPVGAQERFLKEAAGRELRNELQQKALISKQRGIEMAGLTYSEEALAAQAYAETLADTEAYEESVQDAEDDQEREGRTQILKKNAIERSKKIVTKAIVRSTTPTSVGIAWTSYTAQFTFALMSLIFFIVSGILKSSILGTLVEFFSDISSKDLQSYGLVAWGVASIINFGTFVCFHLWYKSIGVKPFDDALTAFNTFGLLACSMVPVLNLLPFIVIWITYMSSKTLFSIK